MNGRLLRALALSLAALSLGGCERWEQYRQERRETRRIRAEKKRAADAVGAVDLPRLDGSPLKGPPMAEIVVAPGLLALNLAPLVEGRAESEVARDFVGYGGTSFPLHREVATLTGWKLPPSGSANPFRLPALEAALEEGVMVEEVLIPHGAGSPASRIAVRADKNAPYELMSAVLYTVGQVGYETLYLLGKGAAGESAIELRLDGFFGPEGMECRECAMPLVSIRADGFLVQASPAGEGDQGPCETVAARELDTHEAEPGALAEALGSPGIAALLEGEIQGPEAEEEKPGRPVQEPVAPDWRGAVMLGPSGACPSVPLKGGQLDFEGLSALLTEVMAMAPGCTRGMVSAVGSRPWSEVIATLHLLGSRHKIAWPQVGVADPGGCEGGRQPRDFLPKPAAAAAPK